MKDNQAAPNMGNPPKEYNHIYFENAFRRLEQYLQNQRQSGPIRVSTINISALPTSATGLAAGDLWNDAGTVKVV